MHSTFFKEMLKCSSRMSAVLLWYLCLIPPTAYLFVAPSSTPDTSTSTTSEVAEPWNLPVIPASIPSMEELQRLMYNNTLGHRIPRHLWMAFKEIPEEKDLKSYQRRMFKRNTDKQWILHLADNKDKLEFMEKYYYNTSTLWAYKIIHEKVGNSAADIWRYAVLWMLGGLYMDDDSYFETEFDTLIRQNDSLVLSTEKNPYNDDCFVKGFHLSARSMHRRYNRTFAHLFGGRTVVSWAVFAEPRHPIMYRTLRNIVELVKMEYLRLSKVHLTKYDARWKMCMCTTGPPVLTASARETILELQRRNISVEDTLRYKLYRRDFVEVGGAYKMPDSEANIGAKSSHYMHTMQKFNIPLLASYAELSKDNMHGRLITANGKELFLVLNGERRGFLNYDAFLSFHFNLRQVAHITQELLDSIPLNNTLLTEQDAVMKIEKDLTETALVDIPITHSDELTM